MKNWYALLGVSPTAPDEDIKRAFRREIARYHPDKVLHLGEEFQQLAAERAAELTEAYRVLTHAQERAAYDLQLTRPAEEPAAAPFARAKTPSPPPPRPSSSRPPPPSTPRPAPHDPSGQRPRQPPAPSGTPSGFVSDRDRQHRMVLDGFVKKEALKRLREAVLMVFDQADEYQGVGFDLALRVQPKRGLGKLLDRPLLLCGRWVPAVDSASIQDAWTRAIRLAHVSRTICLFLVGKEIMPEAALMREVDELRSRLARLESGTSISVVPIDVHDWKAYVSDETPQVVRMILDRLPKQ